MFLDQHVVVLCQIPIQIPKYHKNCIQHMWAVENERNEIDFNPLCLLKERIGKEIVHLTLQKVFGLFAAEVS